MQTSGFAAFPRNLFRFPGQTGGGDARLLSADAGIFLWFCSFGWRQPACGRLPAHRSGNRFLLHGVEPRQNGDEAGETSVHPGDERHPESVCAREPNSFRMATMTQRHEVENN